MGAQSEGAERTAGEPDPDIAAKTDIAATTDKAAETDGNRARETKLLYDGPRGMLFDGMDMRQIGRRSTGG